MAILSGRDGKLSGLHRHMVSHFDRLCGAVEFRPKRAISRAHLPLLLAKVNGDVFARLLFDWFGLVLSEQAKRWFALDGKELRGSILPSQNRGEVCVSALAHHSGQLVSQTYYNGSKESERPAVVELLTSSGLCTQKLTLDALHLTPEATGVIHGAQGVYLIGLKSNQAHLYRHCLCHSLTSKASYERTDKLQRGHGRLDQRTYACYGLNADALASRWRKVGMSTCIEISRSRKSLDGKQISHETRYYVSNARPADQAEAEELFDAIRQHWLIEVTHHHRDVTLAEDELRTKSQAVSRLMCSLRTLAVNLLKKLKPKNMAAQIDEFADNFDILIKYMNQQMVL